MQSPKVTSLLLVFFLCLSACKQGIETPPVPKEKMGKILLDMHLAEVYSQGLGDSVKNKFEKNHDSLSGFYITILKHHDMSFEAFNQALEWYKQRPMAMDSLYANILDQLIEIKAKEGIKDVVAKKDTTAKVTDSVKIKTDTLKRALPDTLLSPKNKKDSLTRKRPVVKPTIKSEP